MTLTFWQRMAQRWRERLTGVDLLLLDAQGYTLERRRVRHCGEVAWLDRAEEHYPTVTHIRVVPRSYKSTWRPHRTVSGSVAFTFGRKGLL